MKPKEELSAVFWFIEENRNKNWSLFHSYVKVFQNYIILKGLVWSKNFAQKNLATVLFRYRPLVNSPKRDGSEV